jgi:hypothetical protein
VLLSRLPREVRARLTLTRHERVLVSSPDVHGRWIVASDRALHVPLEDETFERIPWEQVERGEWDHEADILRIRRIAPFGSPVDEKVLRLEHSERLLRLIRERVTASVIISQHVPLPGSGGRGVRVVARRAPGTADDLTWSMVFDEGLDPSDPVVLDLAEQALSAVRAEVEP